MTADRRNEPADLQEPAPLGKVLQTVGSVKIGVLLIAVIAVALICGTLVDAVKGLEFADTYFYKSTWFIALLAVLAVNILAAIIVRFPWKNRWGFLLAHCGILVLLAGSIQTFWDGIDGQVALTEGQDTDRMQLADWGRFTVAREAKPGEKRSQVDIFPFRPGPVDWPDGKTYDGWTERHGVNLKVLKYYAHARADESWIPAEGKEGEPALRIAIATASGQTMLESWLAQEPLGGPGLPKIELISVPLDSMREDFLNPPSKEEDPDGVLSVHYDGRMQRIPVSKNLGKKVTLEGSKIEVEIVNYYANAKLRGTAQFESEGDEPKNPILDLKVYLPDEKEPIRELAFAKSPLMSLAAMHGKKIPVSFWYHQPAAPTAAGTDFLRTPDGKLYARVGRDGKLVSLGEVKKGSSLDTNNLRLKVLDYFPFAKHKVVPQPMEANSDDKNLPGAALVEVQSGDAKQSVWLLRNDPKYSFDLVTLPNERLSIHFGDETLPLGFTLRLLKATCKLNPGGMGAAAYSSEVQIIDEPRGIDEQRLIQMNEPVTYDKFRFYQSGYNEQSTGEKVSTLKVSYDPGRFLKYLGCWIICIGIALRYLMNWQPFKDVRDSLFPSAAKVASVVAVLLLGTSSSFAASAPAAKFDWESWRRLPVQEDGRQKPLDTLARESATSIGNRVTVNDPESGQLLGPVARYMTMLFDWQGWDASAPRHPDGGLAAAYTSSHKPDKWDQAPLLYVDSSELRKALGLAKNQKYISPGDLGSAKFTDPQTSQTVPFLQWAEAVARADKDAPSNLERKGVELVNHYRQYLADRMGQRLEILPLKGDPENGWASLAMLMRADFDDKTDADGALRKAKESFRKARAAFHKSDVEAFNSASAEFVATVERLGPDLGNYPSAPQIEREVTYNLWAPFRLAWVLASIATVLAVASKLVDSKWLHLTSWFVFLASLAVTTEGFALRCTIAGRAPVTNMYESVLSVAFGVAALGLVYEAFSRKRYVLIGAAALTALVVLFAESCPSICDPRIRPLMPVLRNNFLLCVHVVPTMFSYAAFAVSWLLANVLLYSYIRGRRSTDFNSAVLKLMLKIIRIGVFLLAVGTALGGYFADYSWGRFWGWDSKETWALITLFFYLFVLHARYIGWLAEFGTTAGSVISFMGVVMTWYGVNFVLNTGMHSYGSGSGGIGFYVLAGLIVQGAFLATAAAVYFSTEETRVPSRSDS